MSKIVAENAAIQPSAWDALFPSSYQAIRRFNANVGVTVTDMIPVRPHLNSNAIVVCPLLQ